MNVLCRFQHRVAILVRKLPFTDLNGMAYVPTYSDHGIVSQRLIILIELFVLRKVGIVEPQGFFEILSESF